MESVGVSGLDSVSPMMVGSVFDVGAVISNVDNIGGRSDVVAVNADLWVECSDVVVMSSAFVRKLTDPVVLCTCGVAFVVSCSVFELRVGALVIGTEVMDSPVVDRVPVVVIISVA